MSQTLKLPGFVIRQALVEADKEALAVIASLQPRKAMLSQALPTEHITTFCREQHSKSPLVISGGWPMPRWTMMLCVLAIMAYIAIEIGKAAYRIPTSPPDAQFATSVNEFPDQEPAKE